MTGDGLLELRRRTTLVPGVLIRGELAIGAQLRAAKLVCGRSVWILTMMQSCASAWASAHGLDPWEAPGGGTIL